jgi:hypothetical protein
MATNPYVQPSEADKKLIDGLNEEVRAMYRAQGLTDEQIDKLPKKKPKKVRARKPKAKK